MIIQPFFALLLALPVHTGADAGVSLDQLAACELVVMAQVTAESPEVAYRTVRSKAG
ncbi:MAG: hypothetical protein AMXMBFR61_22390 [Fimbriimonadales bacterium]